MYFANTVAPTVFFPPNVNFRPIGGIRCTVSPVRGQKPHIDWICKFQGLSLSQNKPFTNDLKFGMRQWTCLPCKRSLCSMQPKSKLTNFKIRGGGSNTHPLSQSDINLAWEWRCVCSFIPNFIALFHEAKFNYIDKLETTTFQNQSNLRLLASQGITRYTLAPQRGQKPQIWLILEYCGLPFVDASEIWLDGIKQYALPQGFSSWKSCCRVNHHHHQKTTVLPLRCE